MEMKSMGWKIVFISVYFGETDYMKLESVILNCSKLIKKNRKFKIESQDYWHSGQFYLHISIWDTILEWKEMVQKWFDNNE